MINRDIPPDTPPRKRLLAEVECPPLDDEEVLRRARNARNGESFRRLFDQGDMSEYGDDHDFADFGLCHRLAYWTDSNVEQIKRLFPQSALMRDKWNDPEYQQQTIAEAISLAGIKLP